MADGGPEPTARLYTRTGDGGETGLVGGARVGKDSVRIGAFGAYDELAAQVGWAEALLPPASEGHRPLLVRLEHELFIAMSELATPPSHAPLPHRIERRHVERLEADTDAMQARLPPLSSFVLPRGSSGAAHAHLARTIARRAERALWTLHRTEPQRPELLQWANRLSALLFALALTLNHEAGVAELPPDYTV